MVENLRSAFCNKIELIIAEYILPKSFKKSISLVEERRVYPIYFELLLKLGASNLAEQKAYRAIT